MGGLSVYKTNELRLAMRQVRFLFGYAHGITEGQLKKATEVSKAQTSKGELKAKREEYRVGATMLSKALGDGTLFGLPADKQAVLTKALALMQSLGELLGAAAEIADKAADERKKEEAAILREFSNYFELNSLEDQIAFVAMNNHHVVQRIRDRADLRISLIESKQTFATQLSGFGGTVESRLHEALEHFKMTRGSRIRTHTDLIARLNASK